MNYLVISIQHSCVIVAPNLLLDSLGPVLFVFSLLFCCLKATESAFKYESEMRKLLLLIFACFVDFHLTDGQAWAFIIIYETNFHSLSILFFGGRKQKKAEKKVSRSALCCWLGSGARCSDDLGGWGNFPERKVFFHVNSLLRSEIAFISGSLYPLCRSDCTGWSWSQKEMKRKTLSGRFVEL